MKRCITTALAFFGMLGASLAVAAENVAVAPADAGRTPPAVAVTGESVDRYVAELGETLRAKELQEELLEQAANGSDERFEQVAEQLFIELPPVD